MDSLANVSGHDRAGDINGMSSLQRTSMGKKVEEEVCRKLGYI